MALALNNPQKLICHQTKNRLNVRDKLFVLEGIIFNSITVIYKDGVGIK